jgi:hypothetical protein
MKVAKNAKIASVAISTSKNSTRLEAFSASKVAVARAEAYLARSQKEFVNTVVRAKDSLIRNEAGPLAGKPKDRFS